MRDESNSGFQPPQTLLDAVPAFSPALSSSTRSTRRKRGVAGRRSETNSGAGALFHPARAAGPATPNYHVVSVRCANSVSKVFSTGPKFAILLFLEHKSKKQGYGRNPRLLPARQRTVATRASRRRAAWREIVFAASHQRRSGLLGHVVSGDARDEVRKDGRGPSRRRDCLKISRNPLKTLIPRPGSRPFRGAIRAVGSGWSDTSAPGRLTTKPEKTAADRPGVAVARRICRNPLKTLIPRPGFRAFRGAIRAVGSGCSDTSAPATLTTRPEKTAADRPGGALARRISRNPLKTLIPRPGFRPFRGAIRAVGSGWSDTSAPGRLTTKPENTAADRAGVAVARRICRKPLKTLIPRPGFRPFRGAIRAVGSGCSDASSPAMLTTRPEKTAAGRPGGALARRICRKPLKTLIPCPGFRPFRGAIRAVGSGCSDASSPAMLTTRPEKTAAGCPGGAIARKILRNPLKTLIPRPGPRPFRGYRPGAEGSVPRASDVKRRHLPPRARAVGAAVPDMQAMADALLVKEAAEVAIVVEERVGLANSQNDVHPTQVFQPPRAVEAGQEMRRGVEIDGVVVVAVEPVAEAFHVHRQIVAAGKSDEFAE